MSSYFLDTSAIVKRYHPELGLERVHTIFDEPAHRLATSRLTLTEMQSAMVRRLRLGEIDRDAIAKVRKHLLEEVRNRRIIVLALRPHHFREAGRVLMKYGQTIPVRTLDAIQMASAIDLRERGFAEVLVSSDKHLLAVAKLEGFEVMNPETE
jgi:hypothetical protein